MRPVLLSLALILAGCAAEGEGPVTPPEMATTVAHRAWGAGFDDNHYDLWRELAREEREYLDRSYSERYGFPSHVGPRIFASNVKPPFVVEQIEHLRPGCALSLDALPAEGTPRTRPPRHYLVIWRRPSGAFSWSWQDAWTPQEALSQAKEEPAKEAPPPKPEEP